MPGIERAMDRPLPLVSVVIATYNMGRYLPEAVASVFNQSYSPIEIIVVDDGSTDNTADIVKSWQADARFRYVRQENQGQQIAKNRGIAEAKGDYIAFLDADDRWKLDKLARQIPLFSNPSVGVVYSNAVFIDENGRETGRRNILCPEGKVTEALLHENFVSFGSAVVSKHALDRCGAFDASLAMSIDYDLWLRISTEFQFAYVDDVLLEYRIWP
ncbi:MAG: glycosyltransferase, partial [Chromatiales bacterium]|nr:glycosyltransferase [Chromatiales bacterium]